MAEQRAERFRVTYLVEAEKSGSGIEEQARAIAVEQTAEIPADLIPSGHVEEGLVGRVEQIESLPEAGRFRLTVSYRCDASAFSGPQLLNLLYGNISLKQKIRILEVDLPPSLRRAFGGPRFGIAGLRRLLGVYGRPLACTALKPMGLPTAELARLAGNFSRGGVDLIKDDHGISDQPFHPFAERVPRCQEAVAEANARSGGRTLYFPMLSGSLDSLDRQARLALRHGIRGVLLGPMLAGVDAVRHLSREYGLAVMAHPALTGTFFHDRGHGMAPHVLLGTLFRLFGADISIFPNAGGRFHFTLDECREIAAALSRDLPPLAPAFPCPAGGMSLQRVPELAAEFGPDSVLLIGGDVLRHPDLEEGTRQFMAAIRSAGSERLEPPAVDGPTACEWPSGRPEQSEALKLLRFENFRWSGRAPEAYKDELNCDFRGVVRQELTGRFGEGTAFDLRYFEIEPGGHSSLELHHHEHVIIGVRGEGVLHQGGRDLPIRVHDVGYVGPMEVHQLRNPGREPFGFFCIVDHERDPPRKP